MKKIMILGGGVNQVQLILAAKKVGYYVIVCDWTKDNPGIRLSDKHYQVSSLDYDAVIKVAREEMIDGVISNSEPAMPIVARVAEALNLIGASSLGIDRIMSKEKFRILQRELGLFAPTSFATDNKDEFIRVASVFELPYVVKPAVSSASRGTTTVQNFNKDNISSLFDECSKYSWDKRVAIESFVRMPSNVILDGDIFVWEENIIWDGLFFSTRNKSRPLVPGAQSFPMLLEDDEIRIVKNNIALIFQRAGIRFGQYNLEMAFTAKKELFIVEINVRQGGNHISDRILEARGVDMSKLLVTTAVGDMYYYEELCLKGPLNRYMTFFPVDTLRDGDFIGVDIDESLRKYVVKIDLISCGSSVRYSANAVGALGWVWLEFPDFSLQCKYRDNIEDYVRVIVVDKCDGEVR